MDSLLQSTAKRALSISDCKPSNLISVTHKTIADKTARHLAKVHSDLPSGILIEPESRNTGAAVAFAAVNANPDDVLWIMPADHAIGDAAPLRSSLDIAQRAAIAGHIAIIGIPPRAPSTQFGYIRRGCELDIGGVFKVSHFTEKPCARMAREYIDTGAYYWNAGMIIARAGVICDAIAEHAPRYLNPSEYSSLYPQPFDKLVLEKTHNATVVPCTARWRDVGAWSSLLETLVDNIKRSS